MHHYPFSVQPHSSHDEWPRTPWRYLGKVKQKNLLRNRRVTKAAQQFDRRRVRR